MIQQNLCDAVIVPSAQVGQQLAGRGLRAPRRVVPNALRYDDSDAVQPAERDGAFTMFFAGRLAVEKNLPLLLRGLAVLRQTGVDARVWLAGRGPEEESLRALVRSLGVAERVDFLGHLEGDALARRYKACDVFVLPSVEEVQSMGVIEAMWFERPVVVTSAIPHHDLVDPGVNGFVVDPEDPADLADRLAALARDADARAGMGRAARRTADAFRPARVVDALEGVYRELVARRA